MGGVVDNPSYGQVRCLMYDVIKHLWREAVPKYIPGIIIPVISPEGIDPADANI